MKGGELWIIKIENKVRTRPDADAGALLGHETHRVVVRERAGSPYSPPLPWLRHSLQLLLDHFQLLLAGLHLSLTRADLAGHTHTHGAGVSD